MRGIITIAAFAALTAGATAQAKNLFVTSESLTLSAFAGEVATGDSLVILGQIPAPGGAMAQTIGFRARGSSIKLSANWYVGTAAGPVRTVGVNIDLVDASNTVVGSDAFQGILSNFATSTMTAPVTNGARYTIRMTGTAVAASTYSIVIEGAAAP